MSKDNVWEVGVTEEQVLAVTSLLARTRLIDVPLEEVVALHGAYKALKATATRIPGYSSPLDAA